jgi:type IV pilus assembly protein PilB
VYEVLVLTETLKEFVLNGASATEIKREAIRQGMSTLRRSSLNKVMEGMTTLGEVYRVSAKDD